MGNPLRDFSGSEFNARQGITSEASEYVTKHFMNSESKHIAICGCGASKDALFARLAPRLKSKARILTVSSTGKTAFQEAIGIIKAKDPFREADPFLQEWMDALGHPSCHNALTGRAQVFFAAESHLTRIVIVGEWCDFKDDFDIGGVDVICISALDPNANAFRDLGSIGALLYSGITEEHIVEMMN